MNVIPTDIESVVVIEPQIFEDDRGCFLETFQIQRFKSAGLDYTFVQDNLSFSVRNTLRGLHFQISHPQAKLIQVICGDLYSGRICPWILCAQ
jgi:dTDP-4-dehydrorhamnose 3,5-epimerase